MQRVAARGTALAGIGWAASQALTFVAYIVLARLVSPADFGHFAAASVVVGVGGLFVEGGMMSALVSRRDRIEEAASTAFFALIISGLGLSLAALAVSPLVGLYFRSGRVTMLAAALAGIVFVRQFTIVPDSLLQRRMSFARRVAVDPIGAIAFAGVAIVTCSAGAGAWGLVAGTFATNIAQVIFAWTFARTRPHWELASVAMWRELAAFGRHVLGAEILRYVANQLDAVMLGRFSGAAVLGQYRNGQRFAQQPAAAFTDIVSYVLLPTFVRIRDQAGRLPHAVERVLGAAMSAALPVSIAAIPLGVPIAVLTLGARWRPAGHAIAGLTWTLIGSVVISISAETFKSIGKPHLLVRLHGVNLFTKATFVVAAAIPFGLLGVALAVSASQLTTAAYAYRLLTHEIDVRWRDLLRVLARPAIASGGLLGAMLAVGHTAHPLRHGEATAAGLTVVQALAGGLAYLAVLLLIDPARRHDLAALTWRLRARLT